MGKEKKLTNEVVLGSTPKMEMCEQVRVASDNGGSETVAPVVAEVDVAAEVAAVAEVAEVAEVAVAAAVAMAAEVAEVAVAAGTNMLSFSRFGNADGFLASNP